LSQITETPGEQDISVSPVLVVKQSTSSPKASFLSRHKSF